MAKTLLARAASAISAAAWAVAAKAVLDENSLPGVNGSQGDRSMLRVRGCHVNDVHCGVGDHVDIGIMSVWAGTTQVLSNQIGKSIGAGCRP
jgi:hypothetical protein